ncbi:MAG: dienelactone hydrolase family protein [Gammaproteobacteria bacterium]|nr:dienelactone hydrolase family protein [Gammaproteobacteria bacterium]
MGRAMAGKYDQRLLDLYDGYAHGFITRREFLDRAGKITVSGMTAAAALAALSPDYALANQVSPDDSSIDASSQDYDSPDGAGEMRGYLVKPAGVSGKIGGVVVIHENRGLNPYVKDVARRVAKAGFLAFAPDALHPLGGYPGNDDEGRAMQSKRDRAKMFEDFVAAVRFLQRHEDCNGHVGCVGFCYGGGVANALAVRIPELACAVPFYGRQPPLDDVPKIRAPLMIHHGGLDERLNAGWPAYKEALDTAGKIYEEFTYAGANHGFHNDTTPRYDPDAAELAWRRSVEFFQKYLV